MERAARLGGRRAQVSLEFLVLLAASLAFLSVWLSLILRVEAGVERSLASSRLEAFASDLRESADAVCLMGPGSSKGVKVSEKAELTLSGKEMKLEANGKIAKELLRCESYGGSIKVTEQRGLILENIEGKINILHPRVEVFTTR